MERKVGPGSAEKMGKTGDSCSLGTARSLTRDKGLECDRAGRRWVMTGSAVVLAVDVGFARGTFVGKN